MRLWNHRKRYLKRADGDLISAGFDEAWYNKTYVPPGSGLTGLNHYFKVGAKAGYSPNAFFDEEFYLSNNTDIAGAVKAGDFLSGFDHYFRHGRFEGRSGHRIRDWLPTDYAHLRPMFDGDWYDQTYGLNSQKLSGFDHYLLRGAREGYSPHSEFDEKFYLAFYDDVGSDVSSRRYLCGYEHYILKGRAEGRLTKHDLTKVLDKRHPGLTDPIGVNEARRIQRQLTPIAVCPGGEGEKHWILVPTLDPDMLFGGYKALIELIVGLVALGRPIAIIICGKDDDDGTYFRHSIAKQTRIAAAFETVQVFNRRRFTSPLRLSPDDRIFAYSAWEAHLAHHMAIHTRSGLFAWLVQEYEPIFHDYSAEHAIVAGAYRLPHYPIFNSVELKDYFQHHELGVFSVGQVPLRKLNFAVFNHVLTKLRAPTLNELENRSSQVLMFYARPEGHARRNLFPLALIALEEMAREGHFVGCWEFHGVGALTEMMIPLGRGHNLILHTKMTEAEYQAFMHHIDIGLSLMYAPHPGLVAFEMASVGARVVTNTFDIRSAAYLCGLSENIIPCEPNVVDIKRALLQAIAGLSDFKGRIRGMRINAEGEKSWSDTFTKNFFHSEMSGFLPAEPEMVRV